MAGAVNNEPQRTCIGCRNRGTRSALVRLVARDGKAIVDSAKVMPGRGAWCHPKCLNRIDRRALSRQLRTQITDASELEIRLASECSTERTPMKKAGRKPMGTR